MIEFVGIPMMAFQWVLSSSALACLIVAVIAAVKKTLGNRLTPRWHYLLWFVLIAKMLMPWKLESPFSLWNFVPERAMPAVNAAFEAAAPTSGQVKVDQFDLTLLVLSCVWLTGTIVFFLQTFSANRRFARQLRSNRTISDPAVLRIFEDCESAMSVRTKVRLLESRLLSGPAVFGVVRPSVILPETAVTALRPDQLRYIFLHELAHVNRNDIAVNWVMRMLLAVHWFNPLMWYACYRMREDQEAACDSMVLSRVCQNETNAYGHTLIEMFEKMSATPSIAGTAGLSGNLSQIKRRIVLIRSFRQPSRLRSLTGWAVMSVLCLLVFVAGNSTVQASLALPTFDDPGEVRVMQLSHYDEQGERSIQRLMLGKKDGQWRITFVTENMEIDPAMKGASGMLMLPESGYYSQPGIRNLFFQKSEYDKEWKLVDIREGQYEPNDGE